MSAVEQCQSAWFIAKAKCSGHVFRQESFAKWSIPLRPNGLNCVFDPRFSLDPDERESQIQQILSDYAQRDQPANWSWGPSATPETLSKLLRSRSFMGPRYLPGMELDLSSAPMSAPQMQIEVCQAWEEFDHWEHPLRDFHTKSSKPDVVPFLRELAISCQGKMVPLQCRIEGRIASSLTLYSEGEHGGIFDVVTLPEWRRRGAATALLSEATRIGKERGLRSLCLVAYPKAAPLYERMGFRTTCRITSMYWSRIQMQQLQARLSP